METEDETVNVGRPESCKENNEEEVANDHNNVSSSDYELSYGESLPSMNASDAEGI